MKKIFFLLSVTLCGLGYNGVIAEDKCADVKTSLKIPNCSGPCCYIMPHVKDRLQNFTITTQNDKQYLDYDAANIDNPGISCTLKAHKVALQDAFPYEKSFKNTFYTIIEHKLKIKANTGCGTDICGTFDVTGKVEEVTQALRKNASKWYFQACKYCSGEYGKNPQCQWH